jgi:hypothetical protein
MNLISGCTLWVILFNYLGISFYVLQVTFPELILKDKEGQEYYMDFLNWKTSMSS